ncbi:MAG TPA: hypothetical protein VFM58_13980 [Solirubrobacteraceae bacterium]|nr:hypothetical protein [Solirubrobacteraceae bacterium]
MKGWRGIAAGSALFWGWAFVAAAIWSGEHDDPWAAYIPLLAGAAVTLVASVVAVRDPGRRRERVPLWLSVASGALLLVGTVWGIAGGESGAYAVPLVLAFMLVPLIAALAVAARRFERSPERVRAPLNVRVKRGWTEASKSWDLVWRSRGLLWLPFTSFLLGTAGWIGGYLLAGVWVERTMPRFALTGFIVLLPMTMLATFLGAGPGSDDHGPRRRVRRLHAHGERARRRGAGALAGPLPPRHRPARASVHGGRARQRAGATPQAPAPRQLNAVHIRPPEVE